MKIGDQVSAVDEDLKGMVTSVKGETVFFKDRYGFIHHLPKDKLVLQVPEIYENIDAVGKAEASKKISKKHRQKPFTLDLHFEQLVKNTQNYDASERLFLQKQKLAETLDYCRTHHLKKLEIIHGIGDGVLQKMVFDYLRSQSHIDFDDNGFFYHQNGSVMVTLH